MSLGRLSQTLLHTQVHVHSHLSISKYIYMSIYIASDTGLHKQMWPTYPKTQKISKNNNTIIKKFKRLLQKLFMNILENLDKMDEHIGKRGFKKTKKN